MRQPRARASVLAQSSSLWPGLLEAQDFEKIQVEKIVQDCNLSMGSSGPATDFLSLPM